MKNPPEKMTVRSQLVVIVQSALCILAVTAALLLKSFGITFYAETASSYFELINDSVFTDGKQLFHLSDNSIQIKETSHISPVTDGTDIIIKEMKEHLCLPLKTGIITSPFGDREDNGTVKKHKGIDIGADKGSEIYAVLDGTVAAAEKDDSYGNYTVISHSDSTQTLYAHCDRLYVKKGDTVKKGQKIASVGSTGDADGDHLHFELIVNGTNINPSSLLGDEYQ